MKPFLFPYGGCAMASGKAILAGEHAVVYGHRGVASALPGLELRISVTGEGAPSRSWTEVWRAADGARIFGADAEALVRLWEEALALVRPGTRLADFAPQEVCIASDLPRGAGLGSSAALCVATLRLMAGALRPDEPPTAVEANVLDSLFHGRASGLDVATVLAGGVVEYLHGQGIESLTPACGFWLVLVDTGTRASTRTMVEGVAARRALEPARTDGVLRSLGACSLALSVALREGNLADAGASLDEAHAHLRDLGVSNEPLDEAVTWLRSHGALGAKLTGSGGGGVALGLFAERPQWGEGDAESPRFFLVRIAGGH